MAAVIGGGTCGAIWWLLGTTPAVGTPAEQAALRVELIRTGLSVGAGLGAGLALLLALRRQQLAERTQLATEYDAAERRLTELYVKAAEQLGSDRVPVRLAGLYALERLANDNPAQRQNIVNVICAHLRMPYTPATPGDDSKEQLALLEEREVRFTAQQIILAHLPWWDESPIPRQSGSHEWRDVRLHLTGAVLLDFDCTSRSVNADFRGATFIGKSEFHFCKVTSDFANAVFRDVITFRDCNLTAAGFEGVTFEGAASFLSCFARDGASFIGAAFRGAALFSNWAGNGTRDFSRSTFEELARFTQPRPIPPWPAPTEARTVMTPTGSLVKAAEPYVGFRWTDLVAIDLPPGGFLFGKAACRNGLLFERVALVSGLDLDGLTVTGNTVLDGVAVNSASMRGAHFAGDLLIRGVVMKQSPDLKDATITGVASFDGSIISRPGPHEGVSEAAAKELRRLGWQAVPHPNEPYFLALIPVAQKPESPAPGRRSASDSQGCGVE